MANEDSKLFRPSKSMLAMAAVAIFVSALNQYDLYRERQDRAVPPLPDFLTKRHVESLSADATATPPDSAFPDVGTVLALAAKGGHLSLVQSLIENGAPVDPPD